jgi:hypothetical protein
VPLGGVPCAAAADSAPAGPAADAPDGELTLLPELTPPPEQPASRMIPMIGGAARTTVRL